MNINNSHALEGSLDARGLRVAVVVSRFNSFFVDKLVEGCLNTLTRHGALSEEQTILYVPGASEIPIAALKLAETKKYHGVVCLGAIIRGATSHYDFVMGIAEKGIVTASLQTGIPITHAILTVENQEQALERSGGKQGNLGSNAALSLIETINVLKKVL